VGAKSIVLEPGEMTIIACGRECEPGWSPAAAMKHQMAWKAVPEFLNQMVLEQ
jgi:hypothetical protein